jgi:hypothetical protein
MVTRFYFVYSNVPEVLVGWLFLCTNTDLNFVISIDQLARTISGLIPARRETTDTGPNHRAPHFFVGPLPAEWTAR